MSRPPVRPRARPTAPRRTPEVPAPRIPAGSRSPGVRAPSSSARPVARLRDAGSSALRSLTGDGAPHWFSGLLAGLQGALLSLLAVAVPALAAYVATSADPSNAEVGWVRAVAVGASFWLMGHGAPVTVGGATLTIVPLGVTALALFAAYASARRSAHPTPSAWAAGTVGHVLLVVVSAVLLGQVEASAGGALTLLRLVVGGALVGGVGLGLGTVRLRRIRDMTRPWWERIDPHVRTGAVAGTLVLALLVALASVVTAGWVVAHRAAAGDVIEGLGVDLFGGFLMAVAQLALAPNLVLWVLAWLTGPGFAVGAGTTFSPTEVASGPLPALPMLSALPTDLDHPDLLRWVPVTVVLAGALAGMWLEARTRAGRGRHVLLTCVWGGLAAGVLSAVATLAASGAAGPGRLAVVGASPLAVGLHVVALSWLGMLLAALPRSAAVRVAVARTAQGAWARLRGRADVDLTAPPSTASREPADA
ncbi:hypothetical protein GXB85_01275 [Cellulomonas sp. APG4]|uniref:cell division protein PerM n=1 Tax=Cellulomonas sp. APG4 TaxID=1538656 RepID=UPI001379C777|nr:hypothetical protein [Cellulomonas sp. APG4]